jgi:hypothetical protein
MFKTRKRRVVSVAVAAVLALAIAGVWLVAGTSTVSASEITAQDLQTLVQDTQEPGLLGDGYLAHGGPGRGGLIGSVDYQQLLADALGISVEDLQGAYEQARVAALEKAVEEGLITQEQADEITVWGGGWRTGFGLFSLRRTHLGVPSDAIDEQALLADALGIEVATLEQARETANQAAVDLAIEEGIITQEQADAMARRRTLQSYVERDALLAHVLGMSVDELRQAYADGETLTTLMAQRDLDAVTVRERLREAYQAALDQAVEDGVISQEERDEMGQGPGLGMPFGRVESPWGERGHMPGHRGFRRTEPALPDNDDDSGAGYRHPGWSTDEDSAL